MSDYDESFDDSFDSASDSDRGADDYDQNSADLRSAGTNKHLTLQALFGGGGTGMELPPVRKDMLSAGYGGGGRGQIESLSDQDDWRMKEDKSPKPKRKFVSNFSSTLKKSAIGSIGSIRRPNMATFKQKIKNKLRKDLPIFGVPLEVAIQRSLLGTDGIELPTVFRECISFLEQQWLEQEGLYRLPGVKSKIEDAKSRYDRGEVVDLEDYDPNVVASLLKLYLRELPDSLVPPRTTAKLEAATALTLALTVEEQLVAMKECMDEILEPNKLMLAWIMEHVAHIIQHSAVNKMNLPNLVIVFSPTLQLSAPILHALYNNAWRLFGEVELAKYEKPSALVEKKRRSKGLSFKDFDDLTTEEEISAELDRLTFMLDKLHSKMAGKFDEQKNEVVWDVQRAITELRRRKRTIQPKKAAEPAVPALPIAGGEEEFMKTLLLMEATLAAENVELLTKKEDLQAAIRKETELIDQYKRQLQERQLRLADSYDESGDEGELAKKVATLKWHGKELELRNKNLVQSIKEEGEEIIQLKVKLKVFPLKQKLNTDE